MINAGQLHLDQGQGSGNRRKEKVQQNDGTSREQKLTCLSHVHRPMKEEFLLKFSNNV